MTTAKQRMKKVAGFVVPMAAVFAAFSVPDPVIIIAAFVIITAAVLRK